MLATSRALLTPLLGDQPAYSPQTLFLNGEQGGIYDPADLTAEKLAWVAANPGFTSAQFLAAFPAHTLFQDSAGTTPVTALAQPVGLALDSKTGALTAMGAEAATAAWQNAWTTPFDAFSATTTAFTGTTTGAKSDIRVRIPCTLVTGRTYRIAFTLTHTNVTLERFGFGDASYGFATVIQNPLAATSGVAYQVIATVVATSSNLVLGLTATAAASVAMTGLSVREVPGSHAIQETSASRPLLDARVNLVTYSDEFNNAIWTKTGAAVTANTTVAPDGTTTADTLTATAGAGFHYVGAGAVFLATSYTYTVHVKKGTSRWIYFGITDTALNYFDLDTGLFGTTPATCAATDLGNGWWRLTATATQTAGSATGVNVGVASGNGGGSFTATGTETVIIWRSDLRLTTDIAYPPQRIGAATDYADVGAPRSFLFDGVDDFLVTAANMDLSGTNKVTVLSGVRKNSDAAIAMVCEHSSASTTAVLFAVFAPRGNATANYSFRSRGTTTTVDATSPSTFAAPGTDVLTGQADTGAPLTLLRVNGTEQATSATVQGATNYRADLLYIGRRFNATLPFNGKLYQLIVRGAATAAGPLAQAELYVAGRTGIYL